MSTSTLSAVLASVALVTTCCAAGPPREDAASPAPSAAPRPGPAAPGEAEYAGVLDGPVRLTAGVWEGEPYVPGGAARPRVELVDRVLVEVDLDGDGWPDALTLLAKSTGGSGVWTYLAAAFNDGGAVGRTATVELGQRVQVRAVAARAGGVVVDLVAHGPDEAMCCPTRKVRATFAVDGGALVEVSREDLGAIGLADLEGSTWRLVELGPGEAVPDGVEVTAVFEGDRISGSAGCNRYFATVSADAPTSLAIGPAGTTRMLCEGPAQEVEDRFLPALGAVTGFSFMAGDLVLRSAVPDGVPLALVFERVSG